MNITNANDQLMGYNCSEKFYKANFSFLYTEGVKELVKRFKCYWLLEIIISYQSQLKKEEFQVWALERNENNTAKVIATDGNGKVLVTQLIPYTDFEPQSATVWVENNIILLPMEH